MLLFQGSPCRDPQAVSPASQEQEETPPQQGEGPPHLEAQEGSRGPVEKPSCLPPLLLRRGSLRSRLPEEADWGPGRALESIDRRLRCCLQVTPLVEELPEGLQGASPAHMATKWVDYSNKYGFGYLLSNGSTAVLLPDGTHMASCPQHQRICYCREVEVAESFGWQEVPLCLATKRRVLHFFTQYMQRWLQEGSPCQTSPGRPARSLSLLHFAKSDKALLLLFSDGTLQVNFHHDCTKIVFSRSTEGEDLLTFLDCQRCSTTFPLGTLARQGWTLPLRERVEYALHLLRCL